MFPADAQAIINRLQRATRCHPALDRPKVEVAIAEHLQLLAQTSLPVRWVDDAEDGYHHVIEIALSAALSAARSAARSNSAINKACGIWMPFLNAYEAGLWLYWVMPAEVVAVPRPVLHLLEHRLHCADGPAVHWPNGRAYWFWRGVQVERDWIERPQSLDPKMALTESNTERRRCLYEILGYERILAAVSAKRVAMDDFGELWEAQLDDDRGRPARFVRVKCPSTGRVYVNRVRPEVKTAREAVASRWRLKPERYVLGAES